MFKISVKDSGIGISEEKRENIMQFGGSINFQYNEKNSRSDGIGLRLFIVKKIC